MGLLVERFISLLMFFGLRFPNRYSLSGLRVVTLSFGLPSPFHIHSSLLISPSSPTTSALTGTFLFAFSVAIFAI